MSSDNYEKEAKELVRKMKEQFSMFNPHQKVGEILNRENESTEQGLMENISTKTVNPNILKPGPAPTPAPTTQGACGQCGMLHPPIPPGQKCPNAKIELKSEKDGKDVDINKYLVILRDIILSQIGLKGIKDPDKLFQNITIEITKYLEGYKE